MKKKKKAFTLMEVILALSISTIVLGLIGTFFYVNNNSLIKTNIKSDLQKEGEAIQNQLIKVAQQSKDIKSIEFAGGMTLVDASTENYDSFKNGANTDIREITFNQINDLGNKVPYTFALNARDFTVSYMDGSNLVTIVLSNKVSSFKIVPIDYNNLTDAERSNKKISNAKGVQVIVTLDKKQGTNEASQEFKTLIEFRNSDI